MPRKERISALQMMMMMHPTITATAILVVPSITGKYAGRDMWISPIVGSLTGFITFLIIYLLHKRYPNDTFISYSEKIVGPVIGKIFGMIYLFFVLHAAGMIARQYTDFLVGIFFPRTPMVVMIGSLVLLCAFAVKSGLEVIGRTAQILIPIFLISPLFLLFLIAEWDLQHLFPIMGDGIKPIILGSSLPQAWYSEISLASMLLPFIKDKKKEDDGGLFVS